VKRNLCGFAGLLFLSLTILWGTASASVNPKIILQNYTLSGPVIPGHEIDMTLFLRNIDTSNCGSMVGVQLSASYPISIEQNDAQYLGTICPYEANHTATFRIMIDPLAQAGTYPVSVMTTYEKDYDKFSESNLINLRVAGVPNFSASVISSNPVDVYPGDTAQVTVNFQNNGAGQAESAAVTLESPPGLEVKWAGSQQGLGPIPSHGSASATFTIEAAKHAPPGTYLLNATLEYYGEDGQPASESFMLDMPVLKKAEFSAGTEKNAPFVAGEDRDVVITLTNTGSEEARKLKVSIMPVFPFSTDGTIRYIDSLMPGEQKDLVYVVHVDQDGTAGAQTAGLVIDFEDPQGKTFTDTIDVPFTIVEKGIVYYLVTYWPLIAVVIIAAVVFRNRRKISARLAKKRPKK
jgi:hypothetical protein